VFKGSYWVFDMLKHVVGNNKIQRLVCESPQASAIVNDVRDDKRTPVQQRITVDLA